MEELIIGLDEAGMGALAGPCCIGACIIEKGVVEGVKDSKQLSEKRRYELARQIKRAAVAWNIILKGSRFIDKQGLRKTWDVCVLKAVRILRKKHPGLKVIVDGDHLPHGLENAEAIPGADRTIYAVSAASILAKASRDSLMVHLNNLFPGYSFDKHKGYGVPAHLEALKRLGPSKIHRMSIQKVWEVKR